MRARAWDAAMITQATAPPPQSYQTRLAQMPGVAARPSVPVPKSTWVNRWFRQDLQQHQHDAADHAA